LPSSENVIIPTLEKVDLGTSFATMIGAAVAAYMLEFWDTKTIVKGSDGLTSCILWRVCRQLSKQW
jgi:hypothetical protein